MTVTLVRIADVVDPVESVDPGATPGSAFTYIDISSVDNKSKLITEPRRLLGRDAPSRARQRVRSGDVLVATTRPFLNAVAVVPEALDGEICSTGFAVLRANRTIDARYLFLFVQSPAFIRPLASLVQGALYPAVSDLDVLAQGIPLPDREDQRRLASELTEQLAAVDSARNAASRQRDTAASLRTRAYELTFAGRVPLSTSPTFEDPPNGWSWQALTELARLETGHTPSRSRPDWWDGDLPWIALPDIRRLDGKVALDTIETTNAEGIANSSARILPTDTVVMSRTASVGFVTRMGRPMATSQDFVNWVCGPDLDPEFLMHLLIRSRDEIRTLSSGAIHKTVYFLTVKAFRVCVPAIDEQRRIAAELRKRLAAIDAMEASIRAERAAIEALPAALLRRAFEGLAA